MLNTLGTLGFTNCFYSLSSELQDTITLMKKIDTPNYKLNNYEIRLRIKFEEFIVKLKETNYFQEDIVRELFTQDYRKLLPNAPY